MLVDSGGTGTLQCMHGGTFDPQALSSTVKADDGTGLKTIMLNSAGLKPASTPCPGIAPSGIPPCQFTSPAISMSIRVIVEGKIPVTAMTPQIATTNGMPSFVPLKKSATDVKVL